MSTVVFICPHGAAKSVIAAVYFQQLAEQHALPLHAICGGTKPDDAIAPAVLDWLRAEGLPLPNRLPNRVTTSDLTAATRAIAMNCEIENLAPTGIVLERWDEVPPVSQDLPTARAAIFAHVEKLIHDLNAIH
jgi:protein-tyrosine-phosphatase